MCNDFSYDDLNRLDGVDYLVNDYSSTNSGTESFTMDALGNRTSATLRGESSTTYAVNDLTNRYDETGTFDVTLGYDDAGNTTADQDGYQYAYDYENRIIKIEDGGDVTIATFEYDALGRRIAKVDASVISIFDAYFPHLRGRFFRRKSTFDVSIKVDSIASETTYFYYNNQWQVLCEHDGTSFGNVYIYGNYIDEAVFMSNGVSIYYYAHNQLLTAISFPAGPVYPIWQIPNHPNARSDKNNPNGFSPVALLDSTGAVVERYEYNAYGQVAVLTDSDSDGTWFDDAGDTVFSSSQLGNPYLFTGRRLDTLDDGDYDVMYYRNRYYDTETGRFLTQDALGYVDGVNLYEYVRSSPILYVDTEGYRISSIDGNTFYGRDLPLSIPIAGYPSIHPSLDDTYRPQRPSPVTQCHTPNCAGCHWPQPLEDPTADPTDLPGIGIVGPPRQRCHNHIVSPHLFDGLLDIPMYLGVESLLGLYGNGISYVRCVDECGNTRIFTFYKECYGIGFGISVTPGIVTNFSGKKCRAENYEGAFFEYATTVGFLSASVDIGLDEGGFTGVNDCGLGGAAGLEAQMMLCDYRLISEEIIK